MKTDRLPPPNPLEPILANIPSELTKLSQWVGWKLEPRDGQWTKVPYDPRVRARKAKANDPETWGSFDQAWSWANRNGGSGVGFQFADNGLVGVDLDKCRDAQSGVIEPWAQGIIDRLKSYSEVSPSGTGVHVILYGRIPGDCRRRDPVEMYSSGRYFCVTGHHIDGTPTTIEDGSEALAEIYREVFARKDIVASPQAGDTPRLTSSFALFGGVS